MASKKASAKKAAVQKDREAQKAAIIDTALDLAALQGWHATSLSDIAAEMEIDLSELRRYFSSKAAILSGFAGRMDEEMLKDLDAELAQEPVRDRLFEILMNRFDAMQPYKPGLQSVLSDLIKDLPTAAMLGLCSLRKSVQWMLEGARVESWGPFAPVQEKGLALIYLSVLRVWLKDDDPDMGKTMAALDKALNRVDELVEGFLKPGFFQRRQKDRDPDEEVEAADSV